MRHLISRFSTATCSSPSFIVTRPVGTIQPSPSMGLIAEFNLDGVMLDRAEFRLGRRYGAGWHRQMREGLPTNMFGESRPAAPVGADDRRRSQS